MTIEEEWQEYFTGAAFKSAHTVKSYKNSHKRITDYVGKPIGKASVNELIAAVANLAENPNTQATLFNAILVFRTIAGKDNDKIWAAKKALQPEIEAWRGIVAHNKKQYLPTPAELKKHMNDQFYEENWRSYIINFLLINYNTRNADLNLEFVKSIHTTKANKTKNYIVSRKNDYVYIRNDYKTFSKYGQKRFIFKSVPFGRAVKYFEAQHAPNERVYLLENNGLPIEQSSIANYIKKYTYKNLTEGDYNKVAVSAITDIADIKQLEQLGDRRGTDLKTLITYYNIPYSEKTWGKYNNNEDI